MHSNITTIRLMDSADVEVLSVANDWNRNRKIDDRFVDALHLKVLYSIQMSV